jgi:hypothetical protein
VFLTGSRQHLRKVQVLQFFKWFCEFAVLNLVEKGGKTHFARSLNITEKYCFHNSETSAAEN